MDDILYREIILEHWQNPQNYGVLSHPDVDVEEQNPLCGDTIRLTMYLLQGSIAEILFTGEGCAISRAAASLFTNVVRHKSFDEIAHMTEIDVLETLGFTLTPARDKCALLVFYTLQKGLRSFQ